MGQVHSLQSKRSHGRDQVHFPQRRPSAFTARMYPDKDDARRLVLGVSHIR